MFSVLLIACFLETVGFFAFLILFIFYCALTTYYNVNSYNTFKLFLFLFISFLFFCGFCHLIFISNFKLYSNLILSNGSTNFNVWLNFDKIILANIFLLACYANFSAKINYISLLCFFILTTSILFPPAYYFGMIKIDLKPINAELIVLLLRNLMFVCIPEELFFRKFLQKEVSSFLNKYSKYNLYIAILIASLTFGILHKDGGILYVFLCFFSSIMYGLIYKREKKIFSSVMLHFLVNACHIIFFSYPRLAN